MEATDQAASLLKNLEMEEDRVFEINAIYLQPIQYYAEYI